MTERLELIDLVDAAPDAMLLVDSEGKIVLANRQAESVFGYRREELLNLSVEELIPPRFRDQHRQHRQMFVDNPKLRPMGTNLEIYGLKRSGEEVPVDASLAPVLHGDSRYVLVSVRDISSRKELRTSIEAALYQLGGLRQDAALLKEAVASYADITRRGLLKASYRGALTVMVGILLAITMLGWLSQPFSCEGKALAHQTDTWRYRACVVIFPQTRTTVKSTLEAEKAAEVAKAQDEQLKELRQRNIEILEQVEERLR